MRMPFFLLSEQQLLQPMLLLVLLLSVVLVLRSLRICLLCGGDSDVVALT